MISYEEELKLIEEGYSYVAGADEAGAGSLVGPVYAAAVILNRNNIHPQINDSKKLNVRKREELFDWIKENSICWAVASNSVERIDEINILWARLEAMKKAVYQLLEPVPDCVLVDGDRKLKGLEIEQRTIIKGDGISFSIAAASILAKVSRDRAMVKLGMQHPEYNLGSNKGYWCKHVTEQVKKDGYKKGFHRKKFVEKTLK